MGLISNDSATAAPAQPARWRRIAADAPTARANTTMFSCFHHNDDSAGAKAAAPNRVNHQRPLGRRVRSAVHALAMPPQRRNRLTIVSRSVAVRPDTTRLAKASTIARRGVLIQLASPSGRPVRHATSPPL